jgi:hypothetical protein
LFLIGALIGFGIAWALGTLKHRRGDSISVDEPRGAVEITISATIDGSERFIFTHNSAWDDHGRWQPPKDVMFNDTPWEDLSQAPPGWTELSPTLDLRKAAITVRNGRDTIALEPTAEGFDLYFADTHMGSAKYSVTISIPRR